MAIKLQLNSERGKPKPPKSEDEQSITDALSNISYQLEQVRMSQTVQSITISIIGILVLVAELILIFKKG